MDCPNCKYPNMKVIDSRPHHEDNMRRRRWCSKCGHRVMTEERIKDPKKNKEKSHVAVS